MVGEANTLPHQRQSWLRALEARRNRPPFPEDETPTGLPPSSSAPPTSPTKEEWLCCLFEKTMHFLALRPRAQKNRLPLMVGTSLLALQLGTAPSAAQAGQEVSEKTLQRHTPTLLFLKTRCAETHEEETSLEGLGIDDATGATLHLQAQFSERAPDRFSIDVHFETAQGGRGDFWQIEAPVPPSTHGKLFKADVRTSSGRRFDALKNQGAVYEKMNVLATLFRAEKKRACRP